MMVDVATRRAHKLNVNLKQYPQITGHFQRIRSSECESVFKTDCMLH